MYETRDIFSRDHDSNRALRNYVVSMQIFSIALTKRGNSPFDPFMSQTFRQTAGTPKYFLSGMVQVTGHTLAV